jgi:hypothetical protein
VDGINLAQDGNKRWAVVNTVMNLRVTCSADSLVSSRATAGSAVSQSTVGSGGTTEILVRSQVSPCGICGGPSDSGTGSCPATWFRIVIPILLSR